MAIEFPKIWNWIPLFQVLILILGCTASYLSAFLHGNVNLYVPFISETGAFVPEMGIFSFTLVLGSFIGILMIFYRYILVSIHLTAEKTLLHRLNYISVYIGVLSMIGLAGVAAFPMTTVFWAHMLFAGVYFSFITLYILSVTYFQFKKDGYSPVMKFRAGLCICIMLLLTVLIICFPIALKKWHELNHTIPALKRPGDKGFTLILISSIMEWGIMAVVIAYTLTFLIEFQEYKEVKISISSIQYMTENVKPEDNPCAVTASDVAEM